MRFIWCISIYRTKLLTFPNIPVISLHQPVLSSNLMLGNRNLQTHRQNQTPSTSCHPPPPQTTLLYTVLINYKIHHSINIHNFDAVHVWVKNNMILARPSFYMTTTAGHFSLLLHHTCRQAAEWAVINIIFTCPSYDASSKFNCTKHINNSAYINKCSL